jgi:hypothetical protein
MDLPNVAFECMAFLLHILVVPSLNLSPKAAHRDITILGFCSVS